MKIYKDFIEIFNNGKEIANYETWIYVTEDDFEDLKNAKFYMPEKGEDEPDDIIETEDDLIPKTIFEIDKTMISLVENHTFQAIYENMEATKKTFSLDEKIEALYHYVEEDTFLY